MTIKKKKLPNWLTNPFFSHLYQSKWGVLLSNWLNQGMTYMLLEELFLKLLLDATFFILTYYVLFFFGFSNIVCLLTSPFLAHTINWLLNGHFFNLIRYFGLGRQDYDWFIAYPNEIRTRLLGKRSISGVALYGSLSRGSFSKTSDLDVRVIARPGVMNAFFTSWFVFEERSFAFFSKYPIDIFMATQKRGLDKLRRDEIPVVLINNDNFIDEYYSDLILFEDLIENNSTFNNAG
jgi:predicted nucleotidyltransferase